MQGGSTLASSSRDTATRALIDRLQAHSKLRRLCGFDRRRALPSESTFSRTFDEFAASNPMP